jgi:hypothetical protein
MNSMILVDTNSGRWTIPIRSVVIGVGSFLLGSVSDMWMQRHTGSMPIALLDDVLVGIGVGLLVFLYERRYRRHTIKKLEVIRLMNHHVRNSLQVISFAASLPPQEEMANQVRDAVDRIEWALREVLPGQREDMNDLTFDAHSNEIGQKPRNVA